MLNIYVAFNNCICNVFIYNILLIFNKLYENKRKK
ncbi:MAG: hypothetical protein ACD_4C00194G0001, partial [uncultured bacterium (gcode 4)]